MSCFPEADEGSFDSLDSDRGVNEEGVRNLKRCFETIISKINIHILSAGQTGELSFKLKQVDLPMTLTEDNIEVLLKIGVNDRPPFHMYV